MPRRPSPSLPGHPKAIVDALAPEHVSFADTFDRVDKLERALRGGMLDDAHERAAAHYWLVDLALRCGVLVGRAQVGARGDRETERMLNAMFERVRAIEKAISSATP